MSEIRVDTISEKTSANGVTIDGLTIKDGGITATTGSIVFNEASADVDFRVESDNGTHRFFVDGGNNVVIVGGNDGAGTVPVPINTNGGTDPVFQLQGANNANEYTMHLMGGIAAQNNPPAIYFSKSRSNTLGQHTILENGDRIGEIVFAPADGVDRNSVAAFICADVDGTPGENDTPGRLEFHTTADGASTSTERVRIHSNGVAAFNNGVALGVGTANTASNVLDDYEEGTYTPTFTVASGSLTVHGSHNTLAYTKIGRMVYVQGELRFSAVSSPSGQFSISAPFAVADLAEGSARFSSPPISQSGFGGTPDGIIYLRNTSEGTTNFLIATDINGGGASSDVNANQIGTSTELIFTFAYIAA